MSNKALLVQQLNDVEQERRITSRVSRLARSLECALQIPSGDHLVFVLGSGEESNNHEALMSWLRREIDWEERDEYAGIVPELSGRLYRILCDLELTHSF